MAQFRLGIWILKVARGRMALGRYHPSAGVGEQI